MKMDGDNLTEQEATNVYANIRPMLHGSSVSALIVGLTELLIDVLEQVDEGLQTAARLKVISVLLEDAREAHEEEEEEEEDFSVGISVGI
jgi:hypothetical protein